MFSTSEWTSCPQRKIRSPEPCVNLQRWQGPPRINKVKQHEIVLSLKVCSFSHENKEFVYLVCLGIQKRNKSMKNFPFWLFLPRSTMCTFKVSDIKRQRTQTESPWSSGCKWLTEIWTLSGSCHGFTYKKSHRNISLDQNPTAELT